jgi:hypothetical protein
MFAVTTGAKRDQVVRHIITQSAPGSYVMNLEAFHGTALLAPPAISLEHVGSNAMGDGKGCLPSFRAARSKITPEDFMGSGGISWW